MIKSILEVILIRKSRILETFILALFTLAIGTEMRKRRRKNILMSRDNLQKN